MGSRLQRLLDIPDTVAAHAVSQTPDELHIEWSDGHNSIYDTLWLLNHAPMPSDAAQPSPVELWDGSLVEWPEVEWPKWGHDSEKHKLFDAVQRYGFCVVRDLGSAPDAMETLAAELGYIRETHYGRTFDLQTRATPTILSDLAGPLLPHTDETYRYTPTGINIFHCIRDSGDGGGRSELVDAFKVAALFKERDPAAYALLTTEPIRHERRIPGQTIVANVPAIVLDWSGNVTEVRLNERTTTAISVSEEKVDELYKAFRAILRIAYDPSLRTSRLLLPGDAFLFDNLRVMHGRTGYSGDRFLRQCQVMRDEFYAKGAFLAENAG